MSHKHEASSPNLSLEAVLESRTLPGMISTEIETSTGRAALEERLTGQKTSIYSQLQSEAEEVHRSQSLELLPTWDQRKLWNRIKAFGIEHRSQEQRGAELVTIDPYVAIRYQYASGQQIAGAVRYIEVEYPLQNGATQLVPSFIGFVSGAFLPTSEDHNSFGPDHIRFNEQERRLLAASYLAPQAVVELLSKAGSACETGKELSLSSSIDHVVALVQTGHETALPEEQPYRHALLATDSSTITPLTHKIHSADLQTIFRLMSGLGNSQVVGGMHHGFFFLNSLTAKKLSTGSSVYLIKNEDTHSMQLLLPGRSGQKAVQAVQAGMEVSLVPQEEEAGHELGETILTTLTVANQGGTLLDLKNELR